MECRHLLAPAAAGLLLVAGARARAGEAAPAHPLQVAGGDFPTLVMPLPATMAYAEDGRPQAPGCARIRARRLDELPPDWRGRVASVHLECEETLVDDAGEAVTALTARALLHAGRVRLAGLPVTEVRLMDSDAWGDHQYVVAGAYASASPALREHVETRCRERRLREETAHGDCTMVAAGDGLFLAASEIGGIWIHADPDDAARTIYAEAWAD